MENPFLGAIFSRERHATVLNRDRSIGYLTKTDLMTIFYFNKLMGVTIKKTRPLPSSPFLSFGIPGSSNVFSLYETCLGQLAAIFF